MEEIEVKRCPHCGGKADVFDVYYGFDHEFWVECRNCGSTSGIFSTEYAAITLWNRRFYNDRSN